MLGSKKPIEFVFPPLITLLVKAIKNQYGDKGAEVFANFGMKYTDLIYEWIETLTHEDRLKGGITRQFNVKFVDLIYAELDIDLNDHVDLQNDINGDFTELLNILDVKGRMKKQSANITELINNSIH